MKYYLILLIVLILSCNSNEISYLHFNDLKQSKLPIVGLADINKYNFKNILDSLNFPFCDSTFQYQLKYARGKFLEITIVPPSGYCLEITDRNFTKILINKEGRIMIDSKEVTLEELYHVILNLSENFQEEEYYVIKPEMSGAAMNSLENVLDAINSLFYKYYVESNKGQKISGDIAYPEQPRTINIQFQ